MYSQLVRVIMMENGKKILNELKIYQADEGQQSQGLRNMCRKIRNMIQSAPFDYLEGRDNVVSFIVDFSKSGA